MSETNDRRLRESIEELEAVSKDYGDMNKWLIEKDKTIKTLTEALEEIAQHNPTEVCKDEFAYDRFKEAIREHATEALQRVKGDADAS